jgi:type III pantothenate kinase
VAEVDGIINQYKQQYSNLIFLLTGGDGEYLANRLKNSIFAHQNLILIGLNTILVYHLENN